MVPWVTPQWFRDEALTQFIWSASVMQDADLVLSYQPLQYEGTNSLIGKRLGGVLGHRYADVEQLIADGKIWRDDATTEAANLKKLQAYRVDVLFISNSSWGDLKLNSPSQTTGLFAAKKPRNLYDRRILLSPNNPELAQYVLKTVEVMAEDIEWQKKMSIYNYLGKK